MGQRLIISEEERSRISGMYGLVNEQSSTSSGYKWSKPSSSAHRCVKWVTYPSDSHNALRQMAGEKPLPKKRNCVKWKEVNWVYLDPVTIEIQQFPQLSKLMNHFITNPNSMKDFEKAFSTVDFGKTENGIGFDLPNPEKMYNDMFKFRQLIEDEVEKMNVELNKDKGKPNLNPEEYHFGNYKQVLKVMKNGLGELKNKKPLEIRNMGNKLKK